MFVDDMTLQEARDWEDELSLGLLGATTRRDTEQISNDLEDVRRRIRELEAQAPAPDIWLCAQDGCAASNWARPGSKYCTLHDS